MEPPLIIDLDGTLIHSNLLIETGLVFLRDQPHRFLAPLQWWARGKAALKSELAKATALDVAVLPYNQAVIGLIQAARAQGRRVILATASHHLLAERIAEHLGLFDSVLATQADRNLNGKMKRDVLVQTFGEHGFDYMGNSSQDLPTWRAARHAYVVDANTTTEWRAKKNGNVVDVIKSKQTQLQDWFKALRLHQWLKNILIFVPLLTSHRYTEWPLIMDILLAFLCFGLCASSVYLLNDLLDLYDDRRHPRKKLRPFASGRLSISAGLFIIPFLLVAAFGLAYVRLPVIFSVGLASYYLLTVFYSLVLKRLMMIDVITLAVLYTLRIIIGAMALDIPLSFWLLSFSMFMFLSLALVKRYAELFQLQANGGTDKVGGRSYFPSDLPMIASLGAGAGYIAVLVLALYINDPHITQMYQHHEIIWFACPLLLIWVSRIWMLVHRGILKDEDPVIFAVKDRASLLIGILLALVFWMAK